MGKIEFKNIIKIICDGERVSPDNVFKRTRKAEIVFARQLIMYFARKYKIGSQSFIGKICGGFDHATTLHAEKTINNYIDTYSEKAQKIKEYDRIINGIKLIDYKEENQKLKDRIKELEDENFRLKAKIYNLSFENRGVIHNSAYSGYREHSF